MPFPALPKLWGFGFHHFGGCWGEGGVEGNEGDKRGDGEIGDGMGEGGGGRGKGGWGAYFL